MTLNYHNMMYCIILTKKHLPKPGSYESCLKGQYYAGFLTPEGLETAKLYFQKAIEIDPEFALGYGGLGLVWMSKKQMGYVSTAEANTMIKAYHNHSMQLDSLNSESWTGKAAISTWTDFNWEEGEKTFLNNRAVTHNLCWRCFASGRSASTSPWWTSACRIGWGCSADTSPSRS